MSDRPITVLGLAGELGLSPEGARGYALSWEAATGSPLERGARGARLVGPGEVSALREARRRVLARPGLSVEAAVSEVVEEREGSPIALRLAAIERTLEDVRLAVRRLEARLGTDPASREGGAG